jgi:hypothetical protein
VLRRITLAVGVLSMLMIAPQSPATAKAVRVDDKAGEVAVEYDITSVVFKNNSKSLKAKVAIPGLGTGDVEVTMRTYIDAMKPDGVAMRVVAFRRDGEVSRSGLLIDAPDGTRHYQCDGARARFRSAKGVVVIRLPTRCLGSFYGDQTMQFYTSEVDGLPADYSRRVRVPFD